jgi:hypothetical protein
MCACQDTYIRESCRKEINRALASAGTRFMLADGQTRPSSQDRDMPHGGQPGDGRRDALPSQSGGSSFRDARQGDSPGHPSFEGRQENNRTGGGVGNRLTLSDLQVCLQSDPVSDLRQILRQILCQILCQILRQVLCQIMRQILCQILRQILCQILCRGYAHTCLCISTSELLGRLGWGSVVCTEAVSTWPDMWCFMKRVNHLANLGLSRLGVLQ